MLSPARPFRATPDTRFYFPHSGMEAARQTIKRAVQRGEGPTIVVGGAGLGKSMLAAQVALDLEHEYDIVRMQSPRLTSGRGLLQNILFELQLPYRELSEGELRLSLLDRLSPHEQHAEGGILLLIDEAHRLSVELLEELRLLTNFTRDNQPRAHLVLFGNMGLEELFAGPQLESFNQRLAARCYLQPMLAEQTERYIQHQLQAAHCDPSSVITSEAMHAVHSASEGIPRLVNQLMDHALVMAQEQHQSPISAALIEDVWANLQQLPAPWPAATQNREGAQKSEVEFAELTDDSSCPTTTAPLVTDIETTNRESDTPVTSSKDNHLEAATLPTQPQTLASKVEFAELSDEPVRTEEHSVELADELADDPLPTTSDAPFGLGDAGHANSGFFAAFSEPEENELAVALQTQAPESPARAVAELDRLDAPHSAAASQDSALTGDFFADRPTDEKLIAYEDEQAEYESMGVWEPSAPIGQTPSLPHDLADDSAEALPADRNRPSQATEPQAASGGVLPIDLFGADFDEEFEISAVAAQHIEHALSDCPSPNLPGAKDNTDLPVQLLDADRGKEQVPQDVENELRLAVEDNAEESLPTAPSVRSADYQAAVSVDQAAVSVDQAAVSVDSLESMHPWTIEVQSVDHGHESSVRQTIEELAAQLNFSAMDSDNYSIEELSIEPDAPAKPALEDSCWAESNREVAPESPDRQDANDRDASPFGTETVDWDDDRDLLVIEQHLPKSTSTATPSGPKRRATPYRALFARLRG